MLSGGRGCTFVRASFIIFLLLLLFIPFFENDVFLHESVSILQCLLNSIAKIYYWQFRKEPKKLNKKLAGNCNGL